MSQVPTIIGLFGDGLTFIGGFLLALDAVQKGKEFDKIRKIASTVREPRLARLRFVLEGIEISATTDESEVERAFIQRSVRKAKWGCVILAIGFLCLLTVRLIEFVSA